MASAWTEDLATDSGLGAAGVSKVFGRDTPTCAISEPIVLLAKLFVGDALKGLIDFGSLSAVAADAVEVNVSIDCGDSGRPAGFFLGFPLGRSLGSTVTGWANMAKGDD